VSTEAREFGVRRISCQQLLVGGNWHKRVGDLVGEPVGHVFDQAQIGGFDFEAGSCSDCAMVFDDQERRVGNAGAVALEGDDRDLVHRIGAHRAANI